MDELISAFFEAAERVADLLDDPETAKRWDDPSALEGLSVGGLAAHLTQGVTYIDRLLGAAEAIRDVTGESFRLPYQQDLLNRVVQQAEAALGAVEFRRQCDQGRRLSTEEALALALTQLASHDGEDLLG